MVDKRLEVEIVATDRASKPIKNLQSTIIRFVGAVSASLAALGAVVFPIKAAKDFDRAMRDVQKTTGFTNEEIEILGAQLLNLSKNVDTAAVDLAKIAAAAGQLGLGGEGGQAILTFTESIARAATTLDLTAEDAATSFAKVGSIFRIPIRETERLISVVNELSNTTTATGAQLIDVIQRVGTVAGSFEDAAALAAQAIQLGVSQEVAGTSLIKIFSNFESRADDFAEAFGITVGDFLGRGAVDRWKFYLTELSKLTDAEAAKLINKLSGSGRIFALVDKQVQDAANGFEIFNQAQVNARTAFDEGTSAIEEYGRIAQSLTVQLDILRNNFVAIATTIGLRMVPQLIAAAQTLRDFLQTKRAEIFFDQIAKSLTLITDAFVTFVNVVTSLGAGTLANVLQVVFLGVVFRVLTIVIRLFRSTVAGLINLGVRMINTLRTTKSLGSSLFEFLIPPLKIVTTTADQTAAALERTNIAASKGIAIFEAQAVAIGKYANASKLAAVQASGIAQTAAKQSKAFAAGAGIAGSEALLGDAAIQARAEGFRRELVIKKQALALSQKELKVELQRSTRFNGLIKAQKEIVKLKGADRQLGIRSIEILQKQRAEQGLIIQAASRRGIALQRQVRSLEQQAVIYEKIRASRQSAALEELRAARGVQAGGDGGTAIIPLGGATGRNAAKNVKNLAGATKNFNSGLKANAPLLARMLGSLRGLGPVLRAVGVGIRGIFTLLGGPLSIALTALLFFGEEIFSFFGKLLGFVEEKEAELSEILRDAASQQQAILNKRVADLKKVQNQIQAGFEIDTEITALDAESALEEVTSTTQKASRQLNEYGNALRGVGAQQDLYTQKVDETRTTIFRLERQVASLEEQGGSTVKQREQLDALQRSLEETEKAADELNKTQVQLERGIRSAAREIGQVATRGIVDFSIDVAQFRQLEEQAAELENKIKQLGQLNIEPRVVAKLDEAGLERLRTSLQQILGERIEVEGLDATALAEQAEIGLALIKDEFEKTTEGAKELTKEIREQEAAFSPVQKAIVDQAKVLGRNAEEATVFAEALSAQGITRELTKQEVTLKANAEEILSAKFAYDAQLEILEKQQKQLEANRKAAKGIFDNTIKETQALGAALANINKQIEDTLETRTENLQLDRQIDRISGQIEERTERIKELEEFLAESSDAYANNKARAELSELRSLNRLDEANKIEAEREKATIRLNQLLSQLPELQKQAVQAAEAGQVGPFQIIKDQLDSGIKEAGGLINDLTGLADETGSPIFSKSQIQSFQNALNQATTSYKDEIPNLNKALLDNAISAEQTIANTITEFAEKNKEVVESYKDLLKAFPELAGSLETVRKAWEATNKEFLAGLEEFDKNLQTRTIQGFGLSPTFEDDFNRLSAQGAEAARQADPLGDPTVLQRTVGAAFEGVPLDKFYAKFQKDLPVAISNGIDQIGPADFEGFGQALESESARAMIAAVKQAEVALAGGQTDFSEDIDKTITEGQEKAAAVPLPTVAPLAELRAEPDAATLARTKETFTQGMTGALKDEGVLSEAVEVGKTIGGAFLDAVKTAFGGGQLGAFGIGAEIGKGIARAVTGEETPEGLPFAEGGPVFGPKGIDKVPAWLTHGEYVSDKNTVRAVGGFGFFDMLKRMARGRGSSLGRMRQGLPAFADGGPVVSRSGMAQVNLHLPGAGEFPMFAETDTVSAVARAIKRENLKRGRK